MKKILIVFVAFFYIFTVPVYASEEDILKEPIKEEEEEIKEDQEEEEPFLLKGTGNISNSKSYTTDINNVQSLNINLTINSVQNTYVIVADIPMGEKYNIVVKDNTNKFWQDYVGYYTKYPIIRGQEVNNSTDTILTNGIDEYNLRMVYDSSYYGSTICEAVLYVEPTPEPTPEPEEPEVDPETISGNEILREILRTNREINENVKGIYKYISNNSVSDNVLSDNSVSDNIIYKRLEDYSTSESLALIGLVLAFGALVIYLIHKTVFKIRR